MRNTERFDDTTALTDVPADPQWGSDSDSLVPQALRGEIESLAKQPQWADSDMRPVTRATCASAIAFIGNVLATVGTGARPSAVTPSGNGGISFEWDVGKFQLYVRVEPHGVCYVQFDSDDGRHEHGARSKRWVFETLRTMYRSART